MTALLQRGLAKYAYEQVGIDEWELLPANKTWATGAFVYRLLSAAQIRAVVYRFSNGKLITPSAAARTALARYASRSPANIRFLRFEERRHEVYPLRIDRNGQRARLVVVPFNSHRGRVRGTSRYRPPGTEEHHVQQL